MLGRGPSAHGARRLGPARAQARLRLGASGEDAVAEWYRARGYEILARNWRCRQGELDLVVRGNGALVFCEVKTRTSDAFGLPAEAVTRQKQARVRRLAAIWLSEQGPTDAAPPRASRGRRASARPEIRFDVGVVLAGAVDVLEGAF